MLSKPILGCSASGDTNFSLYNVNPFSYSYVVGGFVTFQSTGYEGGLSNTALSNIGQAANATSMTNPDNRGQLGLISNRLFTSSSDSVDRNVLSFTCSNQLGQTSNITLTLSILQNGLSADSENDFKAKLGIDSIVVGGRVVYASTDNFSHNNSEGIETPGFDGINPAPEYFYSRYQWNITGGDASVIRARMYSDFSFSINKT